MEIYQFLKESNIEYKTDVLLSSLTGMNITGSIPILAKPDSIEKLRLLYQFVISGKYSFDVIGGLTNTYLCSTYIRDIVIQTTKVRDIITNDKNIVVGCGYSLTLLSKELCQKAITGYEGFVGIPGTIGAAAINNSGAFTSVMSDVVRSVTIINKNGELVTYSNADMLFATRESLLKKKDFGVLLSVELDISKKDTKENVETRMSQYTTIRKRDIDGNRKSLGSIIAGHTLPLLWNEHKIANIIKKLLYAPFKYSRVRKKVQCVTEFLVLGGLRFVKHCDNIGRFCWTKDTTETDFFDYIRFITEKSNNKIKLEIEIKK